MTTNEHTPEHYGHFGTILPANTSDDMVISGATLANISNPMPRPGDVRLHVTNVEATDKRVAMLIEMVQACQAITDRYEDKRNELAELRERLASATQNFNDAVSAAMDAGLTFDHIDKAAKRFGLMGGKG